MTPSQCDRILAVLADGQPHRMEEIHQRVGFCRLNSRVAELRTRGHNIACEKKDRTYTYVLLEQPPASDGGCSSSTSTAGEAPPLETAVGAAQLTLYDALEVAA